MVVGAKNLKMPQLSLLGIGHCIVAPLCWLPCLMAVTQDCQTVVIVAMHQARMLMTMAHWALLKIHCSLL